MNWRFKISLLHQFFVWISVEKKNVRQVEKKVNKTHVQIKVNNGNDNNNINDDDKNNNIQKSCSKL